MSDRPLYLFCVAEGAEAPLVAEGLATVSAGGLHAVVRPVDPAEFAALAVDGGEVSDALAELLVHHDAVIRAVFATHNLLPMRFGVAVAGAPALERYLREQGAALRGALDRVRGCEEWGVRWEPPEPPPLPADPPDSGSGYLRRRQAELQNRRQQGAGFRALAQAAHLALAERAAEHLEETSAGRLGATYLVPHAEAAAFAEAAEAQRLRLEAGGARMRVTGPWPPYSFCGNLSPAAE